VRQPHDSVSDKRPREEGSREDRAPDLGATGAAMREEWRSEQEAVTSDAAEQWRHSRTLLDIARDHMHRGDRVEITVAGHQAAGEIVEVASDRIALIDRDVRVDVHIADTVPCAFRVLERARAGGRSGGRSSTFRARLLELEAVRAPVAVATTISPDRLTGSLSVGTDLVVIATAAGVETVISLSAVALVSPAG
jgi:hypothetical protein